jgi:hypothetical protein
MPQLDFFRSRPRPRNTGRMIGPKPPLKPKGQSFHTASVVNESRRPLHRA